MMSHGGGEMPPIGAAASIILVLGFVAIVVMGLLAVLQ
jgi:hypothetical protein